jgi:hypothetical protein
MWSLTRLAALSALALGALACSSDTESEDTQTTGGSGGAATGGVTTGGTETGGVTTGGVATGGTETGGVTTGGVATGGTETGGVTTGGVATGGVATGGTETGGVTTGGVATGGTETGGSGGTVGADTYLSDLCEIGTSTNGWGPIEKDLSNGEQQAGDGSALTIADVAYAKGLGVHAASSVGYAIGGLCTTLYADLGVDDEVGTAGSVVFEVYGDGSLLYQSGAITGSAGATAIQIDVSGVQELQLVVTDGGDGNGTDHADWADLRASCDTSLDTCSGGTGGTGGFPPGCTCLGQDAPACDPTGNVTYTISTENSPTAEQVEAITCAMEGAIAYYNCNTNLTKSLWVSYNPGVPTADGNLNGSIRFGGETYMQCVTAMHEIGHTVGVGTASNWSSLSVGGVFTGPIAIARLQTITGDPSAVLYSDGAHFWPYGLNYIDEAASTADLVGHCRMVDAIVEDLGL